MTKKGRVQVACKAVVTVFSEQSGNFRSGLPAYAKRSILLMMGEIFVRSAVDEIRIVSTIALRMIMITLGATVVLVLSVKSESITP